MHAVGKLLGLLKVWQFALHPDHIRIWAIGNSTVDSAAASALVAVKALSGSGSVPVPVDVDTRETFGDGSGLGIALSFGGSEIFLDETPLVYMYTCIDHFDNCLVEEFEAGLSEPLVFDCLELVAIFAGLLCGHHEVVERLEGGVGDTENEGVVSVINGGGNEGGGFGVCPCDGEEVGPCAAQYVV